MKKISILFFIILIKLTTINAQIAINTDGSTADNSAILDVKSTTKGVLLPRMTNIQIQSIASPADGLIVYSTDDNRIYCFNVGNNQWIGVDYGTSTLSPPAFPDGTVNCGVETIIEDVTNPITGKTWMDRNIGASQVATSSIDSDAFGDLYQWGRFSDGHQCRNSNTTNAVSNNSAPGHANFITTGSAYDWDWLSPHDNTLWQGVDGTNNPCPTGYRIPTEAEWLAEIASWSSTNLAGAYSSPLKLTGGGWRSAETGAVSENGTGSYFSSTTYNNYSKRIIINSSSASTAERARGNGYSIRCIKNL